MSSVFTISASICFCFFHVGHSLEGNSRRCLGMHYAAHGDLWRFWRYDAAWRFTEETDGCVFSYRDYYKTIP